MRVPSGLSDGRDRKRAAIGLVGRQRTGLQARALARAEHGPMERRIASCHSADSSFSFMPVTLSSASIELRRSQRLVEAPADDVVTTPAVDIRPQCLAPPVRKYRGRRADRSSAALASRRAASRIHMAVWGST